VLVIIGWLLLGIVISGAAFMMLDMTRRRNEAAAGKAAQSEAERLLDEAKSKSELLLKEAELKSKDLVVGANSPRSNPSSVRARRRLKSGSRRSSAAKPNSTAATRTCAIAKRRSATRKPSIRR
jgi:hypothetical protein